MPGFYGEQCEFGSSILPPGLHGYCEPLIRYWEEGLPPPTPKQRASIRDPSMCSGHGFCHARVSAEEELRYTFCQCDSGYWGYDCSFSDQVRPPEVLYPDAVFEQYHHLPYGSYGSDDLFINSVVPPADATHFDRVAAKYTFGIFGNVPLDRTSRLSCGQGALPWIDRQMFSLEFPPARCGEHGYGLVFPTDVHGRLGYSSTHRAQTPGVCFCEPGFAGEQCMGGPPVPASQGLFASFWCITLILGTVLIYRRRKSLTRVYDSEDVKPSDFTVFVDRLRGLRLEQTPELAAHFSQFGPVHFITPAIEDSALLDLQREKNAVIARLQVHREIDLYNRQVEEWKAEKKRIYREWKAKQKKETSLFAVTPGPNSIDSAGSAGSTTINVLHAASRARNPSQAATDPGVATRFCGLITAPRYPPKPGPVSLPHLEVSVDSNYLSVKRYLPPFLSLIASIPLASFFLPRSLLLPYLYHLNACIEAGMNRTSIDVYDRCFVTFAHRSSRNACLLAYSLRREGMFGKKPHFRKSLVFRKEAPRVLPAPAPEEVLWVSLGVGSRERLFRLFVSLLFLTIVLIVMFLIVKELNASKADGFMGLVIAAVILLLNQMSASLWVNVTTMEKHYSEGSKTRSVYFKILVTQVVITVVAGTLGVYGFPLDAKNGYIQDWYVEAGAFLLRLTILEALIPAFMNILGMPFKPLSAFARYFATSRTLIKFLSYPPSYILAERCASLMRTVLLCCAFNSGLPILNAMAFIVLLLRYWTDWYSLQAVFRLQRSGAELARALELTLLFTTGLNAVVMFITLNARWDSNVFTVYISYSLIGIALWGVTGYFSYKYFNGLDCWCGSGPIIPCTGWLCCFHRKILAPFHFIHRWFLRIVFGSDFFQREITKAEAAKILRRNNREYIHNHDHHDHHDHESYGDGSTPSGDASPLLPGHGKDTFIAYPHKGNPYDPKESCPSNSAGSGSLTDVAADSGTGILSYVAGASFSNFASASVSASPKESASASTDTRHPESRTSHAGPYSTVIDSSFSPTSHAVYTREHIQLAHEFATKACLTLLRSLDVPDISTLGSEQKERYKKLYDSHFNEYLARLPPRTSTPNNSAAGIAPGALLGFPSRPSSPLVPATVSGTITLGIATATPSPATASPPPELDAADPDSYDVLRVWHRLRKFPYYVKERSQLFPGVFDSGEVSLPPMTARQFQKLANSLAEETAVQYLHNPLVMKHLDEKLNGLALERKATAVSSALVSLQARANRQVHANPLAGDQEDSYLFARDYLLGMIHSEEGTFASTEEDCGEDANDGAGLSLGMSQEEKDGLESDRFRLPTLTHGIFATSAISSSTSKQSPFFSITKNLIIAGVNSFRSATSNKSSKKASVQIPKPSALELPDASPEDSKDAENSKELNTSPSATSSSSSPNLDLTPPSLSSTSSGVMDMFPSSSSALEASMVDPPKVDLAPVLVPLTPSSSMRSTETSAESAETSSSTHTDATTVIGTSATSTTSSCSTESAPVPTPVPSSSTSSESDSKSVQNPLAKSAAASGAPFLSGTTFASVTTNPLKSMEPRVAFQANNSTTGTASGVTHPNQFSEKPISANSHVSLSVHRLEAQLREESYSDLLPRLQSGRSSLSSIHSNNSIDDASTASAANLPGSVSDTPKSPHNRLFSSMNPLLLVHRPTREEAVMPTTFLTLNKPDDVSPPAPIVPPIDLSVSPLVDSTTSSVVSTSNSSRPPSITVPTIPDPPLPLPAPVTSTPTPKATPFVEVEASLPNNSTKQGPWLASTSSTMSTKGTVAVSKSQPPPPVLINPLRRPPLIDTNSNSDTITSGNSSVVNMITSPSSTNPLSSPSRPPPPAFTPNNIGTSFTIPSSGASLNALFNAAILASNSGSKPRAPEIPSAPPPNKPPRHTLSGIPPTEPPSSHQTPNTPTGTPSNASAAANIPGSKIFVSSTLLDIPDDDEAMFQMLFPNGAIGALNGLKKTSSAAPAPASTAASVTPSNRVAGVPPPPPKLTKPPSAAASPAAIAHSAPAVKASANSLNSSLAQAASRS